MNNIANVLIELLCHVTVEPDGGHDIDETADLQIDAWQTLIHDLSEPETLLVKAAATRKLNELQIISTPSVEQEQLIGILGAFIDDELQ